MCDTVSENGTSLSFLPELSLLGILVFFFFMINSHVSPSNPLFKIPCPLHLLMGCKSSSLDWTLHVRRQLSQNPRCPAQCLEHHGHPMDHSSSITLLPLIQLYLSLCAGQLKGPLLEMLVGLLSRSLFLKLPHRSLLHVLWEMCSGHSMSLFRKRANPRLGQVHLQRLPEGRGPSGTWGG